MPSEHLPVLENIKQRYQDQTEFLQAVEEVYGDVAPMIEDDERYQHNKVFERLSEPDRIVRFRVTWLDDNGEVQINRGWRVQHSNLIGPYKGGLRFHPTVSESVLKFLAFEQCFKNALTGLPMGGAKGGSDFDPKGRSDHEIMAFCQAFMTELQRHIGPSTDVPAGDINVGSREIGYLYGQYKKIHNQFDGVLTGKEIEFGGSHVRTEATGYGLIYFVCNMLDYHDDNIEGKTICISGAGNVATYAAKKAIARNAKVITLANSKGTLLCKDGLTEDNIAWLQERRYESDNALKDLADERTGEWLADEKPWSQACDIALPCATQNELEESHVDTLLDNGCKWLAEGANMPCTQKATEKLLNSDMVYVQGKASNAGGVALSGLEMSQNAMFRQCDFEELDEQLQEIMTNIHDRCVEYGKSDSGKVNYTKGANQAGFRQLAEAMISLGV